MASPSMYDFNSALSSYTPQADLHLSSRQDYYSCEPTVNRVASGKKFPRPTPYVRRENVRTTIVHSATIKNEIVGGGEEFGNQSRTAVLHNLKERRRNHALNEAFDTLKNQIPVVTSDSKLSKIKTLRVATAYISYLNSILDGTQTGGPMPSLMTLVGEELNRKNSYTERMAGEQQYSLERSVKSSSPQHSSNQSTPTASHTSSNSTCTCANCHQIAPTVPSATNIDTFNGYQYSQPPYQFSPEFYNYANNQYGYGYGALL